MRVLPFILFSFIVLTTNAQQFDSLKIDSNLYSHAVDSLIKYVLEIEQPSSLILEANASILSAVPNTFQGLEIVKKCNCQKMEIKNNSVIITINKIRKIRTDDKTFVLLVLQKSSPGNQIPWKPYGTYNFEYAFDECHNHYILQRVSKGLIII